MGSYISSQWEQLRRRYRGWRGERRLRLARKKNWGRANGAQGGIHFVIDSPDVGLFAHFTWLTGLADWAKFAGKRPLKFSCVSANYGNGTPGYDWLSQLVQVREEVVGEENQEEYTKISLTDMSEFPTWLSDNPELTLKRGEQAFSETFEIHPEIREEADRLMALAGDFPLVGIHYRGTDKHSEAPIASYETTINAVRRIERILQASGFGEIRIFLATDEEQFAEQIMLAFPGGVIAQREVSRSRDGRALHRGAKGARGVTLAKEAMIDALVLAHCPILLRTASFLSGWSAMMGKDNITFMLNRPFDHVLWFPDKFLIKESFPVTEIEARLPQLVKERGVQWRKVGNPPVAVPV